MTVTGESLERTLLLNTAVCENLPDLVDVDPEQDLAPWERENDGPAVPTTWNLQDLFPAIRGRRAACCCTVMMRASPVFSSEMEIRQHLRTGIWWNR